MGWVEFANCRGAVAFDARKAGAVGEVDVDPVGGQILGRGAFEQNLGAFERLVRLQRAVERRHGDGRFAAAEKTLRKIAKNAEHYCLAHRFSYCAKVRSAPSSL